MRVLILTAVAGVFSGCASFKPTAPVVRQTAVARLIEDQGKSLEELKSTVDRQTELLRQLNEELNTL